MKNNTIIPLHIQIEVVSGICTLKCIMCPIKQRKRKEIMDNKKFIKILNKLRPYLSWQKFLSFSGFGEPLIDHNIHEKIKIAKKLGFHGVGLYTNGTLLNKVIAKRLLNANLDTLNVSIDGFTNKTQQAIRIGSDLNEIVLNVERFIKLRDLTKCKTRIIIRFTRQELNKHEENDFYKFWKSRIKSSYNDIISVYNVHNVGKNLIKNYKLNDDLLKKIRKLKCPEIYERIMINSDGSISFCCGDQFGHYSVGNIFNDDLINIYNSKKYIHYREFMRKGKILDLELCKNCSIVYSITTREINK